MRVLAMDTAFNACSVSFFDSRTLQRVDCSEVIERGHAERLLPMIEHVLSKATASYEDIDLLTVTIGPGAFTGLRVGMAAAKAFAASLEKPLIGVNSFLAFLKTYQLVGQKKTSHDLFAIVLETKRDDYYFAMMDSVGNEVFPMVCCGLTTISDAIKDKNCLVIGDAAERFLSETNDCNFKYCPETFSISHPVSSVIAEIGLNIYESGGYEAVVSPCYLREADVTLPKKADRYLKRV